MSFPALLFALFAAATLFQLAAAWGIFARLAWYQPTPLSDTAARPPVSILICARNEAANLRRHLPAVLEQEYPEFEVVVVDDDSTDATAAVLQSLQTRYAHLRVLHNRPKTAPGKKQALALGIAAARHEYLLCTDADCAPASPHWLRAMAGSFQSGTQLVLGYAPHRPGPGWLNRCIRFETAHTALLYCSFALAGRPYMGVGRNLAWKKELFAQTGGFSAHAHIVSGDDDLLVNAAAHSGNTRICLAPGAFMFSEGKKTWQAWLQQKRRHLAAGPRYKREHQSVLALLAGTLSLHYFLLIPLLFTHFGMVSVVFYTVRMASAFLLNWKILRQFREEHLIYWFPLLDALLAIYYAVFVPLVLIRSNYLISWK